MPVYRTLPISVSGSTLTISSSQVLFADGTAAAPSMSFSADPDNGMYRMTSNILSFAAGGAGQLHLQSNTVWFGRAFISSGAMPTNFDVLPGYSSSTNTAGTNLRISGGPGTGTAAGGALIFQTSPAGGVSGTTVNNGIERMRITGNGELLVGTASVPTGTRFAFDTTSTGHGFRIAGDTFATLHLEDKGASDSSRPFQYITSDDGNLNFGNANRSGTGLTSSTTRMTINSAGQIQVGDGTAAAPVLSFSADVDTGVYRPGADSVGIVTNGTERLRIASQISGPNGSAAGPAFTFLSDQDNGMYRVGSDIIGFATAGVGKLTIESSGNVIVGQGHNGGTPVAGSILGAAGSGTNIAGANLTIAGGNSTGTGAGGELIFQTAAAGSSGSAANTLTERMRITSGSIVYFGNGDFSATPATSTLRGTNGQGTNIAGAELIIQAGAGTGNAASGAVTFRTATAGASGAGTNSSSDRMRVKTNGQVRFMPLAADPAGAETGDVYYNSGTNKLKVYNGTSWIDLH